MTRPKRASLFRTATFRLALVFALVFGLGAAALLLVLDWGIARFAEREMEQALTHQMTLMRADANLEGSQSLANILTEQARTSTLHRYSYLVAAPTGETLMAELPQTALRIDGFGVINAVAGQHEADAPVHAQIMVLTRRANDGSFLAVGRDTYPLEALRAHLNTIAIWGGLGFVVLAMLAGLAAGTLFLRRLERVNLAAARIMEGSPSERLPAIGFGQEFDDLSGRLNQMLDRQEAAMSTLRQVSADIAHDLRTPLNRLRNRLEDAAQAPQQQQAKHIGGAIAEVDEVLSLIAALLSLARIEGGNLRPAMEPVAADALAQTIVSLYQPAAEESSHALHLRATSDAILAGDPVLLNQMLSNILDNALLHTPPQTRIDVAVERVGEEVVFTVADNGPGVPPDARDAILRRFHRLDRSRNSPGAGLGLTLAAAIADRLGGALAVSDNAPGLRIEIRFPAVAAAAP